MCGGSAGKVLGDAITIASVVAAPFTGGLSLLAAPTGMQMRQGAEAQEQQEKQLNQQQKAQRQAEASASNQARQNEQAMNAANRRTPNIAGIMERAASQAAGGPAGTMLTGPMGIDPGQLQLGKNTLLGS